MIRLTTIIRSAVAIIEQSPNAHSTYEELADNYLEEQNMVVHAKIENKKDGCHGEMSI